MGAIRNARQAQRSKGATPRSKPSHMGRGEYHGAPLQGHKHAHADGKAHAHKGGRDPHEHETSAQRFARRYPNAARDLVAHPAAIDAGGPSYIRPTGDGPKAGNFWDRHVLATVLIALIGALALIAVFTPTGEQAATVAPVSPTATARIVVHWQPRATATSTPRATETPRSTPCQAPTLPYCETPPTEQARPAQPEALPVAPMPTAQGASVGGALVPAGLTCSEDSVIGFVAIDTLGCVHVEGRTLEPTNPNTY